MVYRIFGPAGGGGVFSTWACCSQYLFRYIDLPFSNTCCRNYTVQNLSEYSEVLYKRMEMLLTLSANQLEIMGSIYPFYVYNGNRPLAPVLRQRLCSLMYCMMFIKLLDKCCCGDQNTWNTFQNQN